MSRNRKRTSTTSWTNPRAPMDPSDHDVDLGTAGGRGDGGGAVIAPGFTRGGPAGLTPATLLPVLLGRHRHGVIRRGGLRGLHLGRPERGGALELLLERLLRDLGLGDLLLRGALGGRGLHH